MSEKSLFFNAFKNSNYPTGYDRNYNADDLSDWFSIVCETGVLKGGLAVSPKADGLGVKVAPGKATIRGKGYVLDTTTELEIETAPTGTSSRYDLVVLRMDNTPIETARRTYLAIVKGTSSIPTASALKDTTDVKELLLAYVRVKPNATTIAQADIVDTRGKSTLCPWFTAVKGYDDYYDAIIQDHHFITELTAESVLVVTDISAKLYNEKYSLVEVYTNGLKEEDGAFSVDTSSGFVTITFKTSRTAGNRVEVILSTFIDGEGMSTAIAQYSTLVNDVANLKSAQEDVYICNGKNDNVKISELVENYLNTSEDYGSLYIRIVGKFGWSSFVSGNGTSTSPFALFNIGNNTQKVTLDFTNCTAVKVTNNRKGSYCTAFRMWFGKIIGLNLIMTTTTSDAVLRAFSNVSGGQIECEDCRFWITGGSDSLIGVNGTFTNCRGSVSNRKSNSYCFSPSASGILRINGGEYYAYTGDSGAKSAVVGQSQAESVAILYAVNAPTLASSGYYQTNSVYQIGGWMNCTDLISALPLDVVSGQNNVIGRIAKSKPNQG